MNYPEKQPIFPPEFTRDKPLVEVLLNARMQQEDRSTWTERLRTHTAVAREALLARMENEDWDNSLRQIDERFVSSGLVAPDLAGSLFQKGIVESLILFGNQLGREEELLYNVSLRARLSAQVLRIRLFDEKYLEEFMLPNGKGTAAIINTAHTGVLLGKRSIMAPKKQIMDIPQAFLRAFDN